MWVLGAPAGSGDEAAQTWPLPGRSLAACGCVRVSSCASLSWVGRLQWVQASEALKQHLADSVPHVSCLLSPRSEAPTAACLGFPHTVCRSSSSY